MTGSDSARRRALIAAAEAELADLEARGVRMAGNATSSILLVKGALNAAERSGGALLGGADGGALRAALLRLGYPPQDYCALSALARGTVADAPGLAPQAFREAIEAIDPEAVLLLDDAAADAMREAYADALARVEDARRATLAPGAVAHVLGRRVLALGGFEASLADARGKQRMWARIKLLPPQGAPY